MKWIQRHWRAIVRTIAVLLIVVSVYESYFWFYLLGPWKRHLDSNWCRQHSTEAYWDEVKAGIQRLGWAHDDGWLAGRHGDADFMAWAIAHTHPGDDIVSCSAGHRHSGFCKITNQNPGEEADAWLEWWEKNKKKSQVEWIRDGFLAQEVTVSIPPVESDTIPLLTLLGKTDEDENESPEIPGYIKYNASRWLRDSDFNPVAFAISNGTDALDKQVKTGLLEYLKFERSHPKKERVGFLSFGEDMDEDLFLPPRLLTPKIQAYYYAWSFGPLCLGLLLILLTCKKPKSSFYR